MSGAKLLKKTLKHSVWGLISLWTGITFVGYFTPIRVLLQHIATLGLGPWEWFWVLFYAFATYGNAGWLREQVCKYMCPYARFQSVMFDRDTLIVTYDQARGEPRGVLRKDEVRTASELGDCIDCKMCVQVCPTGIDIREGLQYECIGCAACIDACDSVMDKIDLPRGLIRYSTENALVKKYTPAQIRASVLRPRVLVYSGLLLLIVGLLFGSLFSRKPVKLDVIRDRGAMGREVENGMSENVYRLQIMNTSETAHRYKISVSGIAGITLVTADEVDMAPTETRSVPVRVRLARGQGQPGSNKIAFQIQALDDSRFKVDEKAVFIVPRR
jgi:cytochrome c oxidase accessory protein FixG